MLSRRKFLKGLVTAAAAVATGPRVLFSNKEVLLEKVTPLKSEGVSGDSELCGNEEALIFNPIKEVPLTDWFSHELDRLTFEYLTKKRES